MKLWFNSGFFFFFFHLDEKYKKHGSSSSGIKTVTLHNLMRYCTLVYKPMNHLSVFFSEREWFFFIFPVEQQQTACPAAQEESSRVRHTPNLKVSHSLHTYSVFLFLFCCVVVFVTPLKTTTSIYHLLLFLLFYSIIFDTGRPASRSSAWLNKKKRTR